MNARAVVLKKMLEAGKHTGHMSRKKSNMATSDCPPASLYELTEDHKTTVNDITGPPVRPVCGVVTAYIEYLSHLMSKILSEVWKAEDDACMSTEKIMAVVREVNECLRQKVEEEIVIGSADVKALYPSSQLKRFVMCFMKAR